MSNQDTQLYLGTTWGALFQGAQPSGGISFVGPGGGVPGPHRGQNISGAGPFPLPDFDLVPSGRNAEVRGRRGGRIEGVNQPVSPEATISPSVARAGPTNVAFPGGVVAGGGIPNPRQPGLVEVSGAPQLQTSVGYALPPPPMHAATPTLPTRPNPVVRPVPPVHFGRQL